MDRSQTIPGRETNVCFGSNQLRVFLDMGVGIGGDKWPAADIFCNLIVEPQWRQFFVQLLDGKRVLELGSGNGVVGVLIEKAFDPSEICITDLDSHIKHIRHNITLNSCKQTTMGIPYDWTESMEVADPHLLAPFDVILALECVYREDLYIPLIRTIKQQFHSKSVCFLGSTRQFTKPVFFQMLAENGLAYKKLPTDMLPQHSLDESIGMFVLYLM